MSYTRMVKFTCDICKKEQIWHSLHGPDSWFCVNGCIYFGGIVVVTATNEDERNYCSLECLVKAVTKQEKAQ